MPATGSGTQVPRPWSRGAEAAGSLSTLARQCRPLALMGVCGQRKSKDREADGQEAGAPTSPMHTDRPQRDGPPSRPGLLSVPLALPNALKASEQPSVQVPGPPLRPPPHSQLMLPQRPAWKHGAGPHRAPDPSPAERQKRRPGKGAGRTDPASLPWPTPAGAIYPPLGINRPFGPQEFQGRQHHRGRDPPRSLLIENNKIPQGTGFAQGHTECGPDP